MSANSDFIGLPGIEHVAQPPESELCFAAIIAAVSGADTPEAHAALRAAGLSKKDGSTDSLPKSTRLEVAGSVVPIDRFQSPFEGSEDPEAIVGLIDEQFVAARGVVLLHKKNDDPADRRHHWTLFTGYGVHEGEKGAIRTIDPLRQHATWLRRPLVAHMIERTLDHDGAVFAYALGPAAQSRQ